MMVQNGALQCLPQLEDRWPWRTKSLHLLFGIKSNVVHISTGVNEVSSAKLYTWKSGEERLWGFRNKTSSHNLAPSWLHWTWLFNRQLRKLKMSWFKLVKIMGHKEGQDDFNDQNQWSCSMINPNQTPLASSEWVSCLSVDCRPSKKVIRENKKIRLWGIAHIQSGAFLIKFSIFLHKLSQRSVWHLWQKSILAHVLLTMPLRAKKILCRHWSFAQKFHPYTHGMQNKTKQKNSRSLELVHTQALIEMERTVLQENRTHHYLCVHTRNLLLSQNAAAVSNLVVPLQQLTNGGISSPSFVPQCALTEILIPPRTHTHTHTLQMWHARGKDKLRQHQDKDPLSSEGLTPLCWCVGRT